MMNYNIRVYGVLIQDNNVLISDENYQGFRFKKFPGGGHQIGEGLADTIVREFKEELNAAIKVVKHLHVNDYFQVSKFNPNQQYIGHYFLVQGIGKIVIPKPLLYNGLHNDKERFQWVRLADLNPDDFTFQLDKTVIKSLLDRV